MLTASNVFLDFYAYRYGNENSYTFTLRQALASMNTLSNDTNAICLLVFILRRIKNQLRLYHLVKYSLRYNNNKTGLLINVFEKNKSGCSYFRAFYLNEYFTKWYKRNLFVNLHLTKNKKPIAFVSFGKVFIEIQ